MSQKEYLEDYKIDPNTEEASNRSLRTDHLKSRPIGHVNPFVDIEIISSELSNHFLVYKRPPTL
jgi:hypothetical protein